MRFALATLSCAVAIALASPARAADPRMPGTDVVDWIERIPISETRGYVQHVLENAVVYDNLNPSTAVMPRQNRLSAYLGKSNPG